MKIRIILIILLIMNFGCKDEFELESINYKSIMVVDGLISNDEGPYFITLSFASALNELTSIPVESCVVTIYDNTGASENLIEINPGTYSTSVSGFRGVVGNSYSLSIITPEGKEYNTEYQLLRKPIEIESFYAENSMKRNKEFPDGLPGYQFFADTKLASSTENYFLWNMVETYQYNNDYKLSRIFLGYENIFIGDSVITQEISSDTLKNFYNTYTYTCWNTKEINYIFTGKTGNLSTPQISKQPLIFVGTNSKRLTNRYSILLKQYMIDKDAFLFWEGIEKQSTEENFLIASQPYNVIGNIKNSDDSNELVFGYFTVASVIQKRVFVDKPKEGFYYESCNVITDPATISDVEDRRNPPFYYVEKSVNGSILEGMTSYDCIDCRRSGGTSIKPEFWIE